MQSQIKTWASTDEEEDLMNDDHYPLWEQLIKLTVNNNLQNKTILDFGCNQGGFLQLLYERAPYYKALGVDIAAESLAFAAQRFQNIPAEAEYADALLEKQNEFDIAFSHEVLYLLDDLSKHAGIMHKALKEGGTYYAAIGCHTDQSLWDDWVKIISAYSNVKVQNYSLDDYANAFFNNGFRVDVQPFRLEGFFPLKQNNPYFPKVTDTLRYYESDKVVFKFTKK
jgi:SAM-dependent methyltransferase